MAIYTKADYSREVELRSRATKQPIPLTGWALEMVVKASRAATTEILKLSTDTTGLAIDADKPGHFVISMTANQTTAIGAGERVFAVYRTDGGQRVRIMSGRMVVREGV